MGCASSVPAQEHAEQLPALLGAERRHVRKAPPAPPKHTEAEHKELAEHQEDLPDLEAAEDVEPAEHTCSERYKHRTETHVTHVTQKLQEPQQSWPFCCCSARSWELELLPVSAELEKKLQDPQFVAQRCDLDSSGDLDLQELKQAARVFGMKLSMERLQELMAGRPRISKLQFAEMVADLQVSTSKSRRTVPHSLRGMALGQLEGLEAVFVTSGWLAAKCEEFNLEHAEAIQGKRLFKQSPNLYAMESWVVTPMSKPGSCAARDQDCQQTVPQSYEESSFSELVNAFGLVVHCFVSHYWGHIFSKTLAALRLWAKARHWKAHLGQPQSMVFWICLFALNQHEAAEEVGEDLMQGPFNAALAQAEQGAVLILDEEINPFKRIWCLFELSRLHELGKPLELICDLGSMSDPAAAHLQPGMQEMLYKTCEALWNTAASTASSSRQDDKYRIWAEITNCQWKGCALQFGARFLKEMERRSELHEMFSEFDCYVQSLLSTSLLEFLLVHRNYEAAAECCLHGAVTKEYAIDQICSNFPTNEERRSWLNAMLVSRVDDEPMLKLLLNQQADVAARRESDGAPVLVLAAERGYDSAAKLLLSYGADVGTRKIDGVTALIGAAQGGHVSMAKLLLENRADLEAKKTRGCLQGGTALLFATAGGNESVARVLLDSKASMTLARALGAAARFGHEALVKLFLDHKASLNERYSLVGAGACTETPLMLAASEGHVAALKVLLEGRADVTAAAPDGSTALVRAAQREHVLATKLLLHWGADLPPQETSIHFGVECDGCGIEPIVGCRFVCTVCSGVGTYDLCQKCFDRKGTLHAGRCADHAFDRLDADRRAAMFLQKLQLAALFEALLAQEGVQEIRESGEGEQSVEIVFRLQPS